MLTFEEDIDGRDAVMSTAATVASELLDNAAAEVDDVDDTLEDAGVEGSFVDLVLDFDFQDCLHFSVLASKTKDVAISLGASAVA